jgi:effector-binding domain-containing protein
VAWAAHFGAYSELGATYDRLETWRRESEREFAGLSWEVYGHWTENPAELRTDVYFLLRSQGA